MPKFRKRPVIIEAVQFIPDPEVFYHELLLSNLDPEKAPQHFFEGYQIIHGFGGIHCLVETNHGKARLNATDWLITTAAGEDYPCSNAEFRRNYELLPDTEWDNA